MKVIIAGTRTLTDPSLVEKAIKESGFDITEVISGGARGIDKLAELWAIEKGIPHTVYHANWNKYGKSAGIRRNAEMANHTEALIAIWDGVSRGTQNMIETANRKGLKVFVYRNI